METALTLATAVIALMVLLILALGAPYGILKLADYVISGTSATITRWTSGLKIAMTLAFFVAIFAMLGLFATVIIGGIAYNVKERYRDYVDARAAATALPVDPYAGQGTIRAPGGARIALDYIYRPRPPWNLAREPADLNFFEKLVADPPIKADPYAGPYMDPAETPGTPRRKLGTVDLIFDYVDATHPDIPSPPRPPPGRPTPTRMSPPEEPPDVATPRPQAPGWSPPQGSTIRDPDRDLYR